jgi:hypothetical protein
MTDTQQTTPAASPENVGVNQGVNQGGLQPAAGAETQADTQTPQTEKPQATADAPEGWDYIDFDTADRGQLKARFNRLFRQIKAQDRTLHGLRDLNDNLVKRFEALETDHLSTKKQDQVTELRSKLERAGDQGDWDQFAEINRQLGTIEAEQPAEKKAEDKVKFSPLEETIIVDWAGEKGKDGLKRPWAQQDHPWYQSVVQYGIQALEKARQKDPNADVEDVLRQIDKWVATQTGKNSVNRNAAPVLSGDTSVRRSSSGERGLSHEEKRVAERMFANLDPNKAHEKYRGQLKIIGRL